MKRSDTPWWGVDFDGTLVNQSHERRGSKDIGEPIERMVRRVKAWLKLGRDVRIVTARVWHDGSVGRIQESQLQMALIDAWCQEHLGVALPVVHTKDPYMVELWDDRAIGVETNTGRRKDDYAAIGWIEDGSMTFGVSPPEGAEIIYIRNP